VSNRKLLLADDSVTIQKVINLTFADEGIEVMTVGDGDTAMERFQEFRPDIVLADVNMPGLNGYRICENLRQHEESAGIPVILLVGSFESFDENEARRVGANDWMTKPFQSIRQLVNKVTDLLDQPAPVNGDNHAETPVETPLENISYETRPLVMPSSPTSDGEDIDALYRQSMTETVPLPQSYMSEHAFGDTSMDDDMIETSYVASGAPESSGFDAQSSIETDVAQVSETIQPSGDFDFGSLSEPVPVEDRREVTEFDLIPANESSEFTDTMQSISQETVEMNFSEPLMESNVIDFRPPDGEHRPEYVEQVPAGEPAVENEWQKGLNFESPTEPEPEIIAESMDAATVPQHSFDDTEPLEIPPDSTRPSEDGLEEEIIALSGSGLPLSSQQKEQQVQTADDISPEFVDAVARKVIEKISENVIRQLAWQVVPQIAESVLREKMIESQDK